MSNLNPSKESTAATSGQKVFSFMEKCMIKRFHPISIFIQTIGFAWLVYYLWLNNWKMALASLLITTGISFLVIQNVNIQMLSETVLGRLALLHLNLVNLLVQMIGTVLFLYGTWMHSTQQMLCGFSIILLGHLCGWSKFDSRFSLKK